MATLTSKKDLQQYALRRNGHPVVNIEVTQEQLDDAVDLATQIVKPAPDENIWNNLGVKQFTTAFVREQWAINLMKYQGMQMPGGATINAPILHQTAVEELNRLYKAKAEGTL